MGKAVRNRARTAREQIAAQQAAAARAEQRQRVLIVVGSVGLVLAVLAALLIARGIIKPGKQLGGAPISAAVAYKITHVPDSTLTSVGTGSLSASNLPIKPVSGKPLTSGGKPEMLYIGAEYCPFCAATRWSMAVALSRFGTFGPMQGIHSSASDVYPNTPTLTFHKQQYSSPYLAFTPVENLDVQHRLLEVLTKAQSALWTAYGTTQGARGYPFIDFGNKVAITGPLYLPQVLHGLTWAQVADKLKNPSDPVARAVDGEANYITASICKMTGNKPTSVCTAAPITAIESKL
jgi:hypothetical protein